MSGVRVNVVVEGETEEGFVKRVLAPYLSERDVHPTARRVLLSRKGGRPRRGGLRSYHHPRLDIITWLKQDVRAYCTTMFDLYALPGDFPGMDRARSGPAQEKVNELETAFAANIGAGLPDGPKRFIPYLQLHEFEALLFADVAKLDEAAGGANSPICGAFLKSVGVRKRSTKDQKRPPRNASKGCIRRTTSASLANW